MTVERKVLDSGFRPIFYRSGVGGFGWAGMRTQGSPSTNPPNRPRLLVNLYNDGGDLIERPGLAKFTTSSLLSSDACIRLIHNHVTDTPLRLWLLMAGCPSISATVGFSVNSVDQEQDPEFQRLLYYDSTATSLAIASYNGQLHIGADADLKRMDVTVPPWGTEAISRFGPSDGIPLDTYSGFTIKRMFEFDGLLFIACDAGAGASKIVSWDGIASVNEVTATDVPQGFGLYHKPGAGDTIVVGFPAATGVIKYRVEGSAPGSWTTVAAAGAGMNNRGVTYKDVFYFADGAENIWGYDAVAGTLTVKRNIVGAVISDVCVFNGLLYYCWTSSTAHATVGKFDGSSWTDTEKDLRTAFASLPNAARTLAPFRGSLWVGGTTVASGGRFWYSPGTATTGTWAEWIPGATSGAVNFFTVF